MLHYDSTKLSEKYSSPGRIESKQEVNRTLILKSRVLPSNKHGGVFYVAQSKLRGDTKWLHYAEIAIGIPLQVINTHLAPIQQY